MVKVKVLVKTTDGVDVKVKVVIKDVVRVKVRVLVNKEVGVKVKVQVRNLQESNILTSEEKIGDRLRNN
ncbi:hypothetical protein ACF3DV_29175 [Chlorogloeopsis fritschii PCC 9212]|uniref:Uncharacterized protein n=1 Tax=Chlorogloeopsis fritschii PCC 6912 TaxID=211165 RepID=A0A433NKD2_CHLFR|nr:hypothetical protein [Chlorogloeopsis fritschii]MBF2004929.1 hypothetical protein [Chlorogloeopsis fritschii C42_A2020_084]RUR83161.1 hypothetical protein PCC6912_25350 [Chlorogloeopsis fritschii PCC 6912]